MVSPFLKELTMYLSSDDAKKHLKRIINILDNDDDYLDLLLEESEGLVNASIASRYTIPVTETNAISFLRSLVVPILRYKAFSAFNEQEKFPEGVMEEYKATLKILDSLAKQVMSLPDGTEKTTGRAAHIKISEYTSSISDY
jgi:phage gp36-like protein